MSEQKSWISSIGIPPVESISNSTKIQFLRVWKSTCTYAAICLDVLVPARHIHIVQWIEVEKLLRKYTIQRYVDAIRRNGGRSLFDLELAGQASFEESPPIE